MPLLPNYFDHKSVKLFFNKPDFKPIQSINISILSNPRLPDVIRAAVVDCHLQHTLEHPDYNRGQGLLEVGEYLRIIRDLNDLDFDIALNGADNNKIVARRLLDELLVAQRNIMPTPLQLSTLRLACDDDIFLDVLVNNIRNAVISFQSWSRKVSNCKKNTLIKEINQLRQDFIINHNEISALEDDLNNIVESELRARIKAMKLFEGLNSEKPNAMFLSLAKNEM
jgi:hypothetical protein